jgi:hypothetical protein
MERPEVEAVRRQARAAGTVYLLFFVTAVAGTVLAGQAGVSQVGATPADAARIARTYLAHQALFEIGFALTLLSTACYLAVTGLLYRLLRPVSGNLVLVAALFSVMGQALQVVGTVLQPAPLVLLGPNSYLAVFGTNQLQSLALLLLNVSARFGNAGLVFDGLWLIVLGYLIFRSKFLPRALGVLIVLAGLGWETYLVPPMVSHVQVPVEVLGFVAEAALMIWLLVVGLDVRRVVNLTGAEREANVTS